MTFQSTHLNNALFDTLERSIQQGKEPPTRNGRDEFREWQQVFMDEAFPIDLSSIRFSPTHKVFGKLLQVFDGNEKAYHTSQWFDELETSNFDVIDEYGQRLAALTFDSLGLTPEEVDISRMKVRGEKTGHLYTLKLLWLITQISIWFSRSNAHTYESDSEFYNLNIVRSRFLRNHNYLDVTIFDEISIVLTNQGIVVVTDFVDKVYTCLDKDHFNAWTDTISERCNTLFIATLTNTDLGRILYPQPKDIIEFYRNGDHLLNFYGNESYKILKWTESLCMKILTTEANPICVEENIFPEYVNNEVTNLCREFPLARKFFNHIIDLWNTSQNYQYISQLFGLYRHFSHPNVNNVLGFQSIVARCATIRPVHLDHIRKMKIKWRKLFITNYFKKKHKWPNVSFDNPGLLNSVYQAYRQGRLPNTMESYYEEDYWLTFKFNKTFDPVDSLNFVRLINDKVCSADLPDLCTACKKRVTPPARTKQTILRWLQDTNLDIMTIISEISAGNIHHEWLCIGYKSKERELKTEPRCFGLMVYYIRQLITIREHFIADYILPYMPSVTMVDSGLTIEKRMFEMGSRMLSEIGVIYLMMGEDFDKWCTRHRGDEVHPIGEDIDGLIGIPGLYNTTHNYPQLCTSYLADNSVPIDVKDGNLVPGLGAALLLKTLPEGLAQKLWTIKTTAATHYIKDELRVSFEELIQGDNLLTRFTYPISAFTEGEGGRMTLNFRNQERLSLWRYKMKNFLAGLNLLIKSEETWFSHSFMIYGKQMRKNGVQLSTSLKRLCRMFPMSVDTFPSLESCLSTIASAGISSTGLDITFEVSWCLYIMQGLLLTTSYLQKSFLTGEQIFSLFKNRRFKYKVGFKRQREVNISQHLAQYPNMSLITICVMMIITPTSLGGFPVNTPLSYIMRGFPDPVTETLVWLKKLLLSELIWEELALTIENIIDQPFEPEIDLLMLFQNPTSLNLVRPMQQDIIIRSTTLRFLGTSSMIQSELFKKIFSISNSRTDHLVTYLSKMTPLHPRLCSDIIDATIIGIASKVVNKFKKTSTIISMATSIEGNIFLKKLQTADRNTIVHFASTCYASINRRTVNWNTVCATRLAESMRQMSWQRRDIEGVTVAHPLEHLKMYEVVNGYCSRCEELQPEERNDFLFFRIEEKINPLAIFTTVGTVYPYFGSETEEPTRALNEKLKLVSMDKWFQSALVLDKIRGWVATETSNLSALIKYIIAQVVENSEKILFPANMSTSSSVGHRYRDARLKHGGHPNTLLMVLTHIYMSSDTMQKYARGGINVNLHYQASYLLGLFQAVNIFRSNEKHPRVFHYHESCMDCMIPLDESPVDITEEIPEEVKLEIGMERFDFIRSSIDLELSKPAKPNLIMRETEDDKSINFLIDGFFTTVSGINVINCYLSMMCVKGSKAETLKISMNSLFLNRQYIPNLISWWCWLSIVKETVINPQKMCGMLCDERKIYLLNRLTNNSNSISKLFEGIYHNPDLVSALVVDNMLVITPQSSPYSKSDISNGIGEMVNHFIEIFTTEIIDNGTFPTQICLKHLFTLENQPITLVGLVGQLLVKYFQWKERGQNMFDLIVLITLNITTDDFGYFDRNTVIDAFSRLLNIPVHRGVKTRKQGSKNLTIKRFVLESPKKIIVRKVVNHLRMDIETVNKSLTVPENYEHRPSIEKSIMTVKRFPKDLMSGTWILPNKNSLLFSIPMIENAKMNPAINSLIMAGGLKNSEAYFKIHHFKSMYRHIARNTTAAYKLWGLLSIVQNTGDETISGAFLGDGSGGLTKLFADMYPESHFFTQTLLDLTNAEEQILPSYIPGAMLKLTSLKTRMVNYREIWETPSDILQPEFWEMIKTRHFHFFKNLTLCCVDAESDSIREMKVIYVKKLLTSIHSAVGEKTIIIVKVMVKNSREIYDIVEVARNFYSNVNLFRPMYSNHNNGELYLTLYSKARDHSPMTSQQMMEIVNGWFTMLKFDEKTEKIPDDVIKRVDDLLMYDISPRFNNGSLSNLNQKSGLYIKTFIELTFTPKEFGNLCIITYISKQYNNLNVNPSFSHGSSGFQRFKIVNTYHLFCYWIGCLSYQYDLTPHSLFTMMKTTTTIGIFWWRNKLGKIMQIPVLAEQPLDTARNFLDLTNFKSRESIMRDSLRIIHYYLGNNKCVKLRPPNIKPAKESFKVTHDGVDVGGHIPGDKIMNDQLTMILNLMSNFIRRAQIK
ncbi:RNA-dependent RNA polymerase [Hubei myriapoda virus 7]|uniref:RNA-dependent RNA polymerase n=1 Tax=Hubei myriapoda virus 7 TaxID=1922936 RepID=UPI00090CD7FD|nr:RNA-dependent RNA polymerase [Hubei myriapoda virus 7]APG78795.1 RNA-dependent RNA polymerase [Hubei myriapoda virus 7]